MQWSYPEPRRKLIEADLWPRGRMARLACYLAAFAVVLFVLQKLLGLFSLSWGEHLGGWVSFLTFLAGVLFFILGFRWVKRRILWRLRNRLIVTYMFIGVIPAVLLVAMGLITLYGLGGQFAVFVVTSETDAQLRSLAAVNATVSSELARPSGARRETCTGVSCRPDQARSSLESPPGTVPGTATSHSSLQRISWRIHCLPRFCKE